MDEESDYEDLEDSGPPPVVTLGLISLCMAVFVGQSLTGMDGSPFYVNGVGFWTGQYWGLFSSFFVHGDVLQLVVNLFIVWRLGSIMERSLGSAWFLCFWLICTSLSRLGELCLSGDGMGASGFCFAMFGFCLVAGRFIPELALEVEWVVIYASLFFIFLGVSAFTGILIGANLGHFIGFFVGCLLAYGLIERDEVWARIGMAIILLILTVPCYYAPWSSSWNLAQAFRAVDDDHKQFQRALSYLDQVDLPDKRDVVLSLRAQCLMNLGKDEEAAVALKTLVDEGHEETLNSEPEVFNEYAWLLATSTHPMVWNPKAALALADRACSETNYADGELLDTLAVAYAGTGNFDEALKWEQKALDKLPADNPKDKADLESRVKLFQAHQVYRVEDYAKS